MTVVKLQTPAVKAEWAARCLRQYSKHIINSGDTKIIMIDRNLCDVFTGNGWTSRSRYRKMAGRWAHVSGIRLNAYIAALLPV